MAKMSLKDILFNYPEHRQEFIWSDFQAYFTKEKIHPIIYAYNLSKGGNHHNPHEQKVLQCGYDVPLPPPGPIQNS